MKALRSILLGGVVVLVAACAATRQEETSSGGGGGGGSDPASTAGPGGAGVGGQGGDPGGCSTPCDEIQTPQCQKAVCSNGECVIVPDDNGIPCDDGLFCTTTDTCEDGLCVGGPPNDCGMTPDACEEVTCDEGTQSCSLVDLPNGTTCQGDNLCITGSTCSNGVCTGGSLNDCFLHPVPHCHVPQCNPLNGICEAVVGNENGSCVDQNDLCTVNKTCSAGQCVGGSPKDCSGMTQGCTMGVCDPTNGQCVGQPVGNGQPCNDLDACTTGETCTSMVCGGGTPVTTCSMTADGCCPSNCTELDDFDCAYSCELYAIASTRAIYHVDKATGTLTQVATAGVAASTTAGLAQDPVTKTVYLTSTGNDSLFTLDILTGAVTLIGAYGDTSLVMHGLEWDSSTGTLYGCSNGNLYTINTTTGAATLVGATGLTSFCNLGYDSTNDVMYMVSSNTDSTYIIDRSTAAITLIGPLVNATNPHGVAYDASTDQLFLVDPSTDNFATINRTTGVAEVIGQFGSQNLLGLVCYTD